MTIIIKKGALLIFVQKNTKTIALYEESWLQHPDRNRANWNYGYALFHGYLFFYLLRSFLARSLYNKIENYRIIFCSMTQVRDMLLANSVRVFKTLLFLCSSNMKFFLSDLDNKSIVSYLDNKSIDAEAFQGNNYLPSQFCFFLIRYVLICAIV